MHRKLWLVALVAAVLLRAAPAPAATIAGGANHSLGVRPNGSAVAWGSNLQGERIVPAAAQSGVTAVAAGVTHSLVLKANGDVVAWGRNDSGQCNPPWMNPAPWLGLLLAE
jgi:alpha-tubulin suppressor-like RCC1 family protein